MISISKPRAVALSLLVFAAACGSENAVVGGRCRDGFFEANGACVEGTAGGGSTAPPPGGSSATPGPTSTSLKKSAPVTIIDVTSPPPHLDDDAGITDASSDAPVCPPPLVLCHGKCIPVDSDPMNCGACGKICPSNICVAGECQGATPGDVVLVGHDLTNAWTGSSLGKVFLNALAIPTTDPIRVLSYESGAPATSVANVKAMTAGGLQGRKVEFKVGTASALESPTLSLKYDVVIVHAASGGDPTVLGARWADALETFTKKGGVVIVVDSGDTDVPALVTSARLFTAPSHAMFPPSTHFVVAAPSDTVGTQVISPYAGTGASVGFPGIDAESADVAWVVREESAAPGLPIVVHRVVR